MLLITPGHTQIFHLHFTLLSDTTTSHSVHPPILIPPLEGRLVASCVDYRLQFEGTVNNFGIGFYSVTANSVEVHGFLRRWKGS
ncbi:hypothetical protein SERLA73DRAFT_188755 [Serpula lacrymans var. lacrymans S7.3]|uniref:Uncharacterized protein n=1 Tax=Serpula lacrymans var. lacrymans (strain S7.3) TaxID=936435 RepID=F8QC46_SERL3|nr:hypothetical protein SERLA73DRAFT_188755 [Serpula lacrymans var. lacrymans S7.3]